MQRKQHKKYERPSSCRRRHFKILLHKFLPLTTAAAGRCTLYNQKWVSKSQLLTYCFFKKPNKLKNPVWCITDTRLSSQDWFLRLIQAIQLQVIYNRFLFYKNETREGEGKWGTFMSNQAQGLIFCKSLCKIAPMQQMLEIGKWCSARTFSNRREKGTWAQIGRRRKHQMWNRTYPKGKEGRRLENVSIGLI